MVKNPLENELKYLIKNNGPLSIAEFMQHVLFNHNYGYYQTSQPFGTSGDFITAPEISQIFGEIIGNYAAYKWLNNKQESFNIIELGPGNGSLMDDFLRSTKNIPDFHQSLTINLVEISNKLTAIQEKRLAPYNLNIKFYDNFSSIPQHDSFIIANEFFDALPIYQYIRYNNKWCERMVGINKHNNNHEKLSFIIADSDKINPDIIISEPSPPQNNDIYEISLTAMNIFDNIANFINNTNSHAVIIDYGYIKKSYGNTLQSLKQHKYNDIFNNIGTADLTAHVDFDSFINIISKYPKLSYDITTQRNFLLNSGIIERTKQLTQHANQTEQSKLQNSTHRLIDQTQMGELFKVLLIN